ncbi:MAG: hypothetical protein LAO30_21445 [Acidobacteriia bacterium]|nr:hypothetical protein [Terriglobia bacterium]
MKAPMNNADLDLVMFVENIFDTHIPDDEEATFGGPVEMEQWLQVHLSKQRPKKDAAALLRMLAKARERPELAEGLDKTWRREQISVLITGIFRKRNSPMELHEMLLLPRLQRLGRHPSKVGWRNLFPINASVVIFVVLATLILMYRSFLK